MARWVWAGPSIDPNNGTERTKSTKGGNGKKKEIWQPSMLPYASDTGKDNQEAQSFPFFSQKNKQKRAAEYMESTSERDTFISSPSTQNSNNPLYKWLNSISSIVWYQNANIKTNNKTWKGYISLLPYIYTYLVTGKKWSLALSSMRWLWSYLLLQPHAL